MLAICSGKILGTAKRICFSPVCAEPSCTYALCADPRINHVYAGVVVQKTWSPQVHVSLRDISVLFDGHRCHFPIVKRQGIAVFTRKLTGSLPEPVFGNELAGMLAGVDTQGRRTQTHTHTCVVYTLYDENRSRVQV